MTTPMLMLRSTCSLFLAALLTLGTQTAFADEKPRPKTGASANAKANDTQRAAQLHHNTGIESYLAGKYALAISELEKAYALVPDPILLFNIAQAHRKSGANDKALTHYRRYLKAAPQAPDRPDVEKRILELEDVQKAETPQPPPGGVRPPADDQRFSPPPPPPLLGRAPPPPGPPGERLTDSRDAGLTESSAAEQSGGTWKTVSGVVALVAGGAAIAAGTWLLVRTSDQQPCNAPPGAECNEKPGNRSVAGWAAIGGGLGAAVLGGILVYQGRDVTSTAVALHEGAIMTLSGTF